MIRAVLTRLFRPETLFFLALFTLMLLAYRERGFYDPGSLWHIQVGELILTTGFPHTDPFTYTFEGHTWIPQQWGAEVLMALAHRAGGFDTMLLGFAVLVAGLFTAIFRRCLHGGMGWPLAALVVGGCLFVGAFHYFVRPHMFTIALLGWTMMCIVDYERGRAGNWRLVSLIPLFVIWTNLHGGVLGGTMTLGVAVAGWGMVFLVNRVRSSAMETPIRNWRTAFLLVGIVTACLLTPFINPFGMEMLNTWNRIVGSKVLRDVVSEHKPLDPASPLGLAVIGLGAFYFVLLAGTFPRLPRVSWLVPLVWFVLSFQGIRQGPLFAICAAVTIPDLWPHTIWHRLLVKYGDGTMARNENPPITRGGLSWALVPALVVVLCLGLQVTGTAAPVVGRGWARLNDELIPTELTPELTDYAAKMPPGTRVFNDANFGGYLIYHTPSLKIFMDDRCELYGDAWIKEYSDTLGLSPEELGPIFERWAADYQFERAIVASDPDEKPSLELYLLSQPTKWREVARAKRGVIFERVK